MENETNNTEAPEGLSQNEPTNVESSGGDMQITSDSPELTQEGSDNGGVVSQSTNQESQSIGEGEQINIEIASIETTGGVPGEENLVSIAGNTGMSLGMKKFIYVALGVLSILVFMHLNNYEIDHDCRISINTGLNFTDNLSPFICKKNPPPPQPRSLNQCPTNKPGAACLFKPLILLYPEKVQEVNVELEYTPGFSATFPEYDTSKKGWTVTANPDGTLLDHTTQQETYGLFWEGNGANTPYDLSNGWVVKGSELRDFFYEKLTEIGLNTKEKSDFIMFWYPKLQEYSYLQITFAGDDYNQSAPLKITPKPDSLLRVFMVAKPLENPIHIEPQKLEKFERKGFSVVEWGGTIMNK